jgi:hypothetical protein
MRIRRSPGAWRTRTAWRFAQTITGSQARLDPMPRAQRARPASRKRTCPRRTARASRRGRTTCWPGMVLSTSTGRPSRAISAAASSAVALATS